MSKTVAQLVDESFDRVFGITPEVKTEIAALVKELYPACSEQTRQNIAEHAKSFLITGNRTELRANIAALGQREPLLTRRTPSVADVVAFREVEAKAKGMAWGPEARIRAHREASALDDEGRLAAVPTSFKIAAPVEAKPAPASSVSEVEKRDAEILARTGRDPRQMLVSERQRLHAELRNILAEPAPKSDTTIPPLDPTNPERARERINAFRRAK